MQKNVKLLIGGIVGVVVAFSAISSVAIADTSSTSSTSATAPTAPTKNKYGGHVTAVDTTALTITVENKKTGPMTFTVTSSTKIKVNKVTATLADIKVGQVARIVSDDGKAANEIIVRDKSPKPAIQY